MTHLQHIENLGRRAAVAKLTALRRMHILQGWPRRGLGLSYASDGHDDSVFRSRMVMLRLEEEGRHREALVQLTSYLQHLGMAGPDTVRGRLLATSARQYVEHLVVSGVPGQLDTSEEVDDGRSDGDRRAAGPAAAGAAAPAGVAAEAAGAAGVGGSR